MGRDGDDDSAAIPGEVDARTARTATARAIDATGPRRPSMLLFLQFADSVLIFLLCRYNIILYSTPSKLRFDNGNLPRVELSMVW